MGIDKLREEINQEFLSSRTQYPIAVNGEKIESQFALPALKQRWIKDPVRFLAEEIWDEQPLASSECTASQNAGYHIVNISLKGTGKAPGDATTEQMHALADLAVTI